MDKPKSKSHKRKLISEAEKAKDSNENYNTNYGAESPLSNQVNDSIKRSMHSRNSLKSKDNAREISIEGTDNAEPIDIANDSGSDYVPSDEQIDSGKQQRRRSISIKNFH